MKTIEVVVSPVTKLQQLAVLKPICGTHWKPEEMAQNYELVSRKFGTWVQGAVEKKYLAIRKASRMRGCRRFGVEMTEFVNKCNARRICPYCYGREVLGAVFESLWFGVQTCQDWGRRERLQPLHLLVVKADYSKYSPVKFLDECLAAFEPWRLDYQPVGSIKIARMYPAADGWKQEVLGFMLFTEAEEAKISAPRRGLVLKSLPINSKTTLASIQILVSRHLRYPTGLLSLQELPQTVARLAECDKRKNLKLLHSAGLFRNQAERQRFTSLISPGKTLN